MDPDQLADRLRQCFRVHRPAAPGTGGELAAIQAELQAHPAGPAAWARVICSVAVHYRGSDPEGASMVLLGSS